MSLTKIETTARKYGSHGFAFEDGAKYMLKRVEKYLMNNMPYMIYEGGAKEMLSSDFIAKLVEKMEE